MPQRMMRASLWSIVLLLGSLGNLTRAWIQHYNHHDQYHHHYPSSHPALRKFTSSTTTTTTTTSTRLYELTPDEQRKMAVVRSLQMQFYRSSRERDPLTISPETAILEDLPLWHVPWTELPGRSNVLHVHDAVYTNMFETILYGPRPWYVGHLYRDKERQPAPIRAWHECEDRSRVSSSSDPNADVSVVGTLLEIADYRRFEDGRLLLLVKALERFVVQEVWQELPYGRIQAQLLPDLEDMDPDLTTTLSQQSETSMRRARADAVQEAFRHHADFECDPDFCLPVPHKADLTIADIYGPNMTLVLPFVPFAKTKQKMTNQKKNPPNRNDAAWPTGMPDLLCADGDWSDDNDNDCDNKSHLDDDEEEVEEDDDIVTLPTTTTSTQLATSEASLFSNDASNGGGLCLEQELLTRGVLQSFPFLPNETATTTLEDLEHLVWLALDVFLKRSKAPVSPVLLGLLPPTTGKSNATGTTTATTSNNHNNSSNHHHKTWPRKFALAAIADQLRQRTDVQHCYVALDPATPLHRRCRLLSFAATSVLEGRASTTILSRNLRQELLQLVSTRARLRRVLLTLQRACDELRLEQGGGASKE